MPSLLTFGSARPKRKRASSMASTLRRFSRADVVGRVGPDHAERSTSSAMNGSWQIAGSGNSAICRRGKALDPTLRPQHSGDPFTRQPLACTAFFQYLHQATNEAHCIISIPPITFVSCVPPAAGTGQSWFVLFSTSAVQKILRMHRQAANRPRHIRADHVSPAHPPTRPSTCACQRR